jgi:RHS repeat-associated protein
VESGFTKTADANNHLSGFSYDASGNTLGDGVNTYTWDGESQLKSGGGVNYLYDGDGRRVSKSGGASKLYWYGSGGDILAETDSCGNPTAEYIFFDGKRVAMIPWTGANCSTTVAGNPTYYIEDLLGTSRVVTTNTGVVCYDADYYPFGGERTPYTNNCPATNNYKFQGKERDGETGNDDFGARYYSNRFGRWLSADWSLVPVPVPYANLTSPQTLNLYAMVSDDPESFADLDGHLMAQTYQVANPAASSAWNPGDVVNSMTNDSGLTDDEVKSLNALRAAQAAAQAQNQNNTTGYSTQDAAAKAVLGAINPKSIKKNKEYAGLIYKDAEGKYHYTKPHKGNGTTSDVGSTPNGTTVVGDYHTHGDYSRPGLFGRNVRTTADRDAYDSNHFSDDDTKGNRISARANPQFRGYLGTPSGALLIYNPITDREGPLQ